MISGPIRIAGLLVALALAGVPNAHSQGELLVRTRILNTIDHALAESDSGRFAQARATLERSLAGCDAGPAGRECRILYASGLGSLHFRQAGTDWKQRDRLYQSAVAYYDRILAEEPDNPEALYGKALSYRAMGNHEWMEPFFQDAPRRDPARKALYFTFLGDYYAGKKRWSESVGAYARAVQQNPEEDGARSGLVSALAEKGPSSIAELLRYAEDWESRYPSSAADAYRAILAVSFSPVGQPGAGADSALVGLVRTQARNGGVPGEVPPGVSRDWPPVLELRSYLNNGGSTTAPWWMMKVARREALAQAALADGQSAVTMDEHERAEQLWIAAADLLDRTSAVRLALQRELALLYFRQPTLDPGGHKFATLEGNIFYSKSGAIETGDREAVQRFHTTLGLIYVARGEWRVYPPKSAKSQLAWALDAAEDREQQEGFYQPLPELRVLLARGLDSLGEGVPAARRYGEAAAAFLDVDDLAQADSAIRNANRLGHHVPGTARVLRLRSMLRSGGSNAAEACDGKGLRMLESAGPPAFVARQRFKVLADCTVIGPAADQRRYAIAAFRMVDSAGAVLVGGADVVRLERVMLALLEPFGMEPQPAHLDRKRPDTASAILVSLPAESKPLWHSASPDDIVAGRVIAELGPNAEPFPLSVSAGVLSIPGVPATRDVPRKIRKVPGVRDVQIRAAY